MINRCLAMSVLFTRKFTRVQIAELTGLTGGQVDTLKKQEFIKLNKRRYDCQSLLIAAIYSEYNKYFNCKGLTNTCKSLLEVIKTRVYNEFDKIKNPMLFAFNNQNVMLLPVDDLLAVNLKKETKVIDKEDDVTCHFQELSLIHRNGKAITIPNTHLSIDNCYKINMNLLIEQLEDKYIELHSEDINIA